MSFHQKADLLIAGFKDGTVQMWGLPKGKEVASFYGHIDEITQCDFTPDGKAVISSSMDSTIRVWSPKTQLEKVRIDQFPFHTDGVVCFVVHPDENKKLVLSGSMDMTVCISNYETGKTYNKTPPFEAPVQAVSIALTWNIFMVGTTDGWLKSFDLDSFKELSAVREDTGIIHLQFVPELKYFVASTVEGKIVVHTYGKSEALDKMKVHDGEIHQFKVVG
jgi:WD40 repeat protein